MTFWFPANISRELQRNMCYIKELVVLLTQKFIEIREENGSFEPAVSPSVLFSYDNKRV